MATKINFAHQDRLAVWIDDLWASHLYLMRLDNEQITFWWYLNDQWNYTELIQNNTLHIYYIKCGSFDVRPIQPPLIVGSNAKLIELSMNVNRDVTSNEPIKVIATFSFQTVHVNWSGFANE